MSESAALPMSSNRRAYRPFPPSPSSPSLMMATAAGIGCFLAFIGLQKSEGLGVITFDGATLVTLGGCPPEEQVWGGGWRVEQVCRGGMGPWKVWTGWDMGGRE